MDEQNRVTISLKEREEMLEKAKARALERGKAALKTTVDQRVLMQEKENMVKWRREVMLQDEQQRAHENAVV